MGLANVVCYIAENPYFFTDEHPHNLPKIGALAVEIWTTNAGIQFDNFLVSYDQASAFDYATKTWKSKYQDSFVLNCYGCPCRFVGGKD